MNRELNPQGCQTRIYGNRDCFGHQCPKKPTVTRDGELYCKIHDPEYIKQKKTEQRAKWDKEDEERHQLNTLVMARKKATQGLTLTELSKVTPDLIRQAIKEAETGA